MDYNADFIHGAGIDVSQFSEGNPVSPGVYSLNVMVNGERRGRYDISFKAVKGKQNAEAYFTAEELQQLGIKSDKASGLAKGQTYRLSELIPDSLVYYNSSDLELDIQVPQANQVQYPRGYTDPSRWEKGEPAAYFDYNANFYGLSTGPQSGDDRSDDYTGNIGLLSGINIDRWRLRQRSNFSWLKGESRPNTQSLATYAATDITALKSQLTLGDSNTTGKVFDSYSLRGVQLKSDDRMLPEGLRNYSPIVRGVAETNAKVTITQHGLTVYQTVVTPGLFELTDIGAMGYGGDLEMTITEANGMVRTSIIPFSAPPMLLHKDVASFELLAGELNDDTLKQKPKVAQGILQYGIGNNYTLYGGSQIASHYYALSVGNAINTRIGGLGFDIIRAWSEVEDGKHSSGNSYNVSFTKYMEETATNLTMAAYRYSTKGFYSLRDASIARGGRTNDDYNVDYRTKERVTASLSQTLWDNSSLNLSGSLYTYWSSEQTAKQYAVTWTKSLRYFSFALTTMRTSDEDGNYDNTYMASINVPIGRDVNSRPLFNSIYSTYSHSTPTSDSFQMNANGSRGEQNELTYGIGTSVQKAHDEDSLEAVSGNLNYRSPVGQFGMTTGVDSSGSSRQLSLSANGSVVAHKGGVTLGPSVGEMPFAIVGAPGAKGAKIYNGQGAKIDGRGYAVMPSLTAYRENAVALDYKSVPDNVDVLESQRTVVPRDGAIIAVNMKTIEGTPIVLIIHDEQHNPIPVGSELIDDKGVNQGVTGQGGMAFVRGWDPDAGNVFVLSGKDKCRIIPEKNSQNQVVTRQHNSVIQMEVTCYRH
ncbi:MULTISPECIES: fimbria/pilus outer membrane usher protein [Enterobacterales]|uniref:fimbria/pilus outer membrane usher protein n=1 Tax=Enterobacterales TaxID=91347 RepID=UPI002EDB5434